MLLLDEFDLFHGEASHNVAYVYARFPNRQSMGDTQSRLVGSIHGPHCAHSRTLPFSVKFQDGGPGESLLLRAVIPDPCFWSPEVPSLYHVTIERKDIVSGEVHERTTRDFGIRAFGVSQQNLLWENKRWVLRGVSEEASFAVDLSQWREAGAVCKVAHPDDTLCAAASREGVMLVALMVLAEVDYEAEIRRLARWPAVAIVIIPAGAMFSIPPRRMAPNLIFAEYFHRLRPIQPSSWADLVVVDISDSLAARIANCPLPVIASRLLQVPMDLLNARLECDHLQRDLVRQGDFAGYVV